MDTTSITSQEAPAPQSQSQPQSSTEDTKMQLSTPQSLLPIPLTSPLRTHPKRGLPPILASTYPHGHISGHARSPSQQAAFAARKEEMMKTMTKADMERRYEEKVKEIRGVLEEMERKTREVEGEMEKLKMDREMERRVWGKLRRMKEGGG